MSQDHSKTDDTRSQSPSTSSESPRADRDYQAIAQGSTGRVKDSPCHSRVTKDSRFKLGLGRDVQAVERKVGQRWPARGRPEAASSKDMRGRQGAEHGLDHGGPCSSPTNGTANAKTVPALGEYAHSHKCTCTLAQVHLRTRRIAHAHPNHYRRQARKPGQFEAVDHRIQSRDVGSQEQQERDWVRKKKGNESTF